ncbi:C6 transcription factor [Pleurostoma richardsiae]|uniref:C6 transcription factor n=1 Tax=Pleurostoma richardsiae TaxID=41990 RepID=A0AA38VFW2_9PEZI|nr:C6 transcription factor [Pleurostoma richardsiae]
MRPMDEEVSSAEQPSSPIGAEAAPSSQPSRSPHLHRQRFRRSAAACERCRRRKQKCDGKLPICSSCAQARVPCIPSERLVVRSDSNCNCAELREHVSRLEAEIQLLTSQLASKTDVPQRATLHVADSSATDETTPLPQATSGDKPQYPDAPYSERILRPTFAKHGPKETVEQSFWSSPWHLWGDMTVEPSPGAIDPGSLSIGDYGPQLIEIFFARRWSQFPILHRGTFYNEHYLPLSQELPPRPLSSFQVNMVFAIAAAERGPADSQHRLSHEDFFRIAVRDLHLVLAEDDLACIQCLLLLCMYGSNEPQSVNMWYTTGLALRLAVGIDLHRYETVAGKDLFNAEMCKRLFWSVYLMDRSMSIAMGRPLGIRDADITVPLPLQLTDDQLRVEASGPVMANLVPQCNDTSTFVHVIKLRRINAEIYQTLHSVGSGMMDSAALDAIRHGHYVHLNEWLVSAPRYFPTPSMFQMPEWFQIAYHHAVLSLYRPSHGAPVASLSAVRLCLDSSISLISCYASLYAKNKITYTFVALNSLFMAGVTMLHSLRASAAVRQELGKPAAEANVKSCVGLLHNVSRGRAVGARCAQIIERLGHITLTVFDQAPQPDEELDIEFLSWFGLKCHHSSADATPGSEQGQAGDLMPSIDVAWNDLFAQGFKLSETGYMNLFL